MKYIEENKSKTKIKTVTIQIGEVNIVSNVIIIQKTYKIECRATRTSDKAKVGSGAMEE